MRFNSQTTKIDLSIGSWLGKWHLLINRFIFGIQHSIGETDKQWARFDKIMRRNMQTKCWNRCKIVFRYSNECLVLLLTQQHTTVFQQRKTTKCKSLCEINCNSLCILQKLTRSLDLISCWKPISFSFFFFLELIHTIRVIFRGQRC